MTIVLSRMRPVTLLSILCGSLLAAYVALMIATILFAALQTQLAQNVQDKHAEIGKLESAYYEGVTALDSVDPQALGYVTPAHVTYVTQANVSNLTFAR